MLTFTLLGSTGSIGTQTLDVARKFPHKYQPIALSTNTNIDLLESQADEFAIKEVCVFNKEKAKCLQERRSDFHVSSGEEGLIRLATLKNAETVVVSVVGRVGFTPTEEAIKQKKHIALANKETLVVGGEKIMQLVQEYGVTLFPIDSEHSAIHQCLHAGKMSEVKKIWLTASGGPFRDATQYPFDALSTVSVEEALNHPTWKMGKKISIDSATLANKGLEFIEAMHLFQITPENIEVVIHPQSLIHSAVEFQDGSFIAEMGATDMRRCISYALSRGERELLDLKPFSFFGKTLTFEEVDRKRFPCLLLAEQSARRGDKACAVFNNTNEEAVYKFLGGKIGFMDIPAHIKKALESI